MTTPQLHLRQWMGVSILLTAALIASSGCSAPSQEPTAQSPAPAATTETLDTADPADIPPERPTITMATTAGDITIELYSDLAPANVQRFLSLMDSEFYTKASERAQSPVTVHHVVPHKRFYSGIYDTTWTARHTEPVFNESDNGLKNIRGTIALTPQDPDDPDSAQCGFVVHAADAPHLDYQGPDRPGLTVIGRVVAGMDTVDAIVDYTLIDLHMGKQTFKGVPVSPIFIEKIYRSLAPLPDDTP